jgi:hypothetical protein
MENLLRFAAMSLSIIMRMLNNGSYSTELFMKDIVCQMN